MELNKINQHEFQLSDCQNENIDEYIEAYEAPSMIHN